MDFRNKLECLSLASLSNLVQCLQPTHKHYTKFERLARDKHFSLLQKSVNYGSKKFYSTCPRIQITRCVFDIFSKSCPISSHPQIREETGHHEGAVGCPVPSKLHRSVDPDLSKELIKTYLASCFIVKAGNTK